MSFLCHFTAVLHITEAILFLAKQVITQLRGHSAGPCMHGRSATLAETFVCISFVTRLFRRCSSSDWILLEVLMGIVCPIIRGIGGGIEDVFMEAGFGALATRFVAGEWPEPMERVGPPAPGRQRNEGHSEDYSPPRRAQIQALL